MMLPEIANYLKFTPSILNTHQTIKSIIGLQPRFTLGCHQLRSVLIWLYDEITNYILNVFVYVFLFQYADPVADLLDKWDVFHCRLFRESCVFHRGNYVKDLSRLGRELHKIIIVDNSPASYVFHPDNAVSSSFFLQRGNQYHYYYSGTMLLMVWRHGRSRTAWPHPTSGKT